MEEIIGRDQYFFFLMVTIEHHGFACLLRSSKSQAELKNFNLTMTALGISKSHPSNIVGILLSSAEIIMNNFRSQKFQAYNLLTIF